MNRERLTTIGDLLKRGIDAREPRQDSLERFAAPPNPSAFFPNADKVSPSFEYSHELLLRAIKTSGGENGHVLDLGAGTGRLSRLVLERYPGCRVVLSDFSRQLLDEATLQLAPFKDRIQARQGDFFGDLSFADGQFDCVISAYAVCHGRSLSDYRGLYARITESITPTGCFLCLDLD